MITFKNNYKEKVTELFNTLGLSKQESRNYNNLENKLLSLLYYMKTYNGKDVTQTSRYSKLLQQAEELFMEVGATSYLPPKNQITSADKKKNKVWKQYCELKGIDHTKKMMHHLNSELFRKLRVERIKLYAMATQYPDKDMEKLIKVASGGHGYKGAIKTILSKEKTLDRNSMLNWMEEKLPKDLIPIFKKDVGFYKINP